MARYACIRAAFCSGELRGIAPLFEAEDVIMIIEMYFNLLKLNFSLFPIHQCPGTGF